jgi:hypothetical protein
MAKKKDETTETTETGDATNALVSKLTLKALGCDPRLSAGQNSKVLCRIFGTANGLKTGEDKNTSNVWVALQGEFEGQNVEEGSDDAGKVLRSGKLFLPGGIQDVIEGKIREIENTSGGSESPNVTFGLEIRSVKSTNRIGYSYEARNLMPPKQLDPLAAMRAAIEEKHGKVKLLPAPKE